MPKSPLLIPFAWSQSHGRMVEAAEVDKGERLVYVCPGCSQPVLARKGRRNRAHFAHASDTPCTHGLESSVHRAAKQIIETQRKLWLPASIAFPLYPENMQPVRASPAQVIEVDRVDVESTFGSIRPDLIVWRQQRLLAIEIEVTHPVSDVKSRIFRQAGLSALAINLRGTLRSISLEALRDRLLSPSRETRWVHNDFAESLTARFRREAVTRSLTWRTSHKHIGKIPHVDTCPFPPRISKADGETFANAKLDCLGCPYCIPPSDPRKFRFAQCVGHIAGRFPKPMQEDWLCLEQEQTSGDQPKQVL